MIKTLEAGTPFNFTIGSVHYRAGDHQQVRPVPVLQGKKPGEMDGKDDFFRVVDVIPGSQVMQPLNETSCNIPPYT